MSSPYACPPRGGKFPAGHLLSDKDPKAAGSGPPPPDTHSCHPGALATARAKQNPAACHPDSHLLLRTYRVLGPDRVITVLHSVEVSRGDRTMAAVN